MKKMILASLATILTTTAFASDIHIPATERWLAQSHGFTCGADNTKTENVPQEFKDRAIIFNYMTTDYTLDHGKFTAGFFENGVECRYNLIVISDNANMVLTYVDSTAYAINGGSSCAEGKAYLDSLFVTNKYFYARGTMAIQLKVADASAVCGEGSETAGLFFKKAQKPKIEQPK